MATAARPGTTPGHHTGRREMAGYRVVIGDDVYKLYKADISTEDHFRVRRETGRAFQSFLSDFDIDTVAMFVWLARIKAGEKRLSWVKVLQQLPSDAEFQQLAEEDLFDFDVVDDLDTDGEEDVSADPLPSDGS